MPTAFEQLADFYRDQSDLGGVAALLSWDQQTYMPPRGSEARARQSAALDLILHSRLADPRIGDLLAEAGEKETDPWRLAWLRELRFVRDRRVRLPAELVREFSLATSRAFSEWVAARKARDFSRFAPSLEHIVALTRQKAECYGYTGTPWNALVPDYERGMDADSLKALLTPLADASRELLRRILDAPPVETRFLEQKWDIAQQREFGLRVARDLGYDMRAGRQDVTPHPFCTTIGRGDVRITTRYSESSLLDSLMATIHESGHAMYEQGMPESLEGSPLAEAPSMGMHESQSRFWEIRVAHSRPFWERYYPILQQYFPGHLDEVPLETFYRAVNRVVPGLTRVEADEVCYNLHVVIRFTIELELFDGSLEVGGLPERWNALYREYLGLDVPDDAAGCLQDVHWSYGAFGYFPTYSVGNIYGAMIAEKLEAEVPKYEDALRSGNFAPILAWLRENIHRHGSIYSAAELVERMTGKAPTAQPLITHLERKYGEVYNLR